MRPISNEIKTHKRTNAEILKDMFWRKLKGRFSTTSQNLTTIDSSFKNDKIKNSEKHCMQRFSETEHFHCY